MASAFDRDSDIVGEHRPRERQRFCALGQIDQHIERGERGRRALQVGNSRNQVAEQALEQQSLARKRPLLCRECFVLE